MHQHLEMHSMYPSYSKFYSKRLQLYEDLKGYNYEMTERRDPRNFKLRKIYTCKENDCNREFTIVWNLLDHLRMHKGVKPYKWQDCGKRFTQMGNYKKHLRTHTGRNINDRKVYRCEVCLRSYTERYNLRVSFKLSILISNITRLFSNFIFLLSLDSFGWWTPDCA